MLKAKRISMGTQSGRKAQRDIGLVRRSPGSAGPSLQSNLPCSNRARSTASQRSIQDKRFPTKRPPELVPKAAAGTVDVTIYVAAFALILVALAVSFAAEAQTVGFFCTFRSSPTDCGFHEQAKEPGHRASIVKIGRDHLTAVRLHTEPGDNQVAGSLAAERNDLALSQTATDCYEGREQWWAHSILFPDDYVDPPMSTGSDWNWGAVAGFHNSAPGPWLGNFTVTAMPATATSPDRHTGLWFQGYGGVNSGDGPFEAPIGPVVRNVWYDFVYHVKWSSGADGFFDAWVNGQKKLAHRGPTLYAGQGCYLKLANYHSAYGRPSSVIHTSVIRGTMASAVSSTPLQ